MQIIIAITKVIGTLALAETDSGRGDTPPHDTKLDRMVDQRISDQPRAMYDPSQS
jgi:hypothetical protein